jgi:hypothetical protein
MNEDKDDDSSVDEPQPSDEVFNRKGHIENAYEGTKLTCFERVDKVEKIRKFVEVNGICKKKVEKPPPPVRKSRHEKPPFDIDRLDQSLNKFQNNHNRAIKNWQLVKFRLQVIKAFGPLSNLAEASDSDEYIELE